MKVDSKVIGPCKVKVFVKAEADETRSDYEEVLGMFLKNGRVTGFRPGKAPREIIKRDFHKEITEEVLEGPRSVVFDQAENKMHLHKAILESFLAGGTH